MARKEQLRKAYEFKIGKQRASKLSDAQINLLSKYYNSLSKSEQDVIDNALVQGRSNDLTDMADSFIEENEDTDVEENNTGAIVKYEPTKDEKIVDKEVDERILTLIGQEGVVDIDYGTYKTLLKEKMIAGRMVGSQLSTEEIELLTNEYKEVKSNTGRFRIKKKRISAESFTEEPLRAETKPQTTKLQSLVPSSKLRKVESESEKEGQEFNEKQTDTFENLKSFIENTIVPALSQIGKNLEEVISNLKKQTDLEIKEDKKKRIVDEKSKKRSREEDAETPKENKFKKGLEKIAKPVKGFIERLIEIFSSFLLGAGLLRLIQILRDPKGFLQGLIDWANGIVGFIDQGLVMIVTPFYNVANTVISSINSVGQKFEDTMNSVRGLFGAPADDDIFTPLEPLEVPETILPRIPNVVEPEPDNQPSTPVPGMMGGGEINKDTGITISGMGPDTQLIAAQPGEIVMSKPAVDSIGADNLLTMNASSGGTNRPRMGIIPGFQGGGLVGSNLQHSPVKIDASGESGVDFTPAGINNRVIFDGRVSDIGHQYNPKVIGGDRRKGAGYGNYIAITSTDSETGEKFESLYAHFPKGELDNWKVGDEVKYGDVLGRMATAADYANPITRKEVGSGTGPHSSVDFFVPGTNKPYPHWRSLVPRIDPSFPNKPYESSSSKGMNSGNKTFVESALSFMNKYYPESADVKVKTPELNSTNISPQQTLPKSTTASLPPRKTGSDSFIPIPIPTGGGQQNMPITSASGANQAKVPQFSSTDVNNPELIAIKAIYNIVGNY